MRPSPRLITLVSLLSSLMLCTSPLVAKETSEDRPVRSLGGAVHADPFTGVATTSIPIEVPPGRNGMQPHLALTYNSANGNGWIGMGWDLEQAGIFRQTQDESNHEEKHAINFAGSGTSDMPRQTTADQLLVAAQRALHSPCTMWHSVRSGSAW